MHNIFRYRCKICKVNKNITNMYTTNNNVNYFNSFQFTNLIYNHNNICNNDCMFCFIIDYK